MNSRGTILIITLWILAILILFVLGLGFRISLETKMTGYNVKTFKLFYTAKAAVNSLKEVLRKDETPDYDSLNEDWSNNEGYFKDVMLGEGIFTISYIRGEEPAEKVFYGAIDEEAKININTAPKKILLNLPDITEEIADSILDWRDEDDTPHASGAESVHYRSLDSPYSCKNGPFQSKEELLLVKGMTPEILGSIKDIVTIYGDGKVNLNTADSRIMEALGLTEEGIREILKHRAGDDEEEGTSDDIVFMDVSRDIINSLDFSDDDKTLLTNLNSAGPGLIGVASNYFRAYVTAKTKDGRIIKMVEAVVSHSGEESGVEFWYEY